MIRIKTLHSIPPTISKTWLLWVFAYITFMMCPTFFFVGRVQSGRDCHYKPPCPKACWILASGPRQILYPASFYRRPLDRPTCIYATRTVSTFIQKCWGPTAWTGRGECEQVSGIGTWLRHRGINLMDKPFQGIHPLQAYNVQVRPVPVKSFGDDHGRLLQIVAIR